MWYLINSTGYRLYLKPNEELTFGRKKSHILLQNDESISRLHASIYVETKDVVKMNEPISTCKLKDMDSKYGTYILLGDEERIEVTIEGYYLKNQDRIRFGLQQHIFTVIYVPIITVVSTLNDNDKKKLQTLMDEIDGLISADWTSNCTHLTVSKATLTEKVTWAMASAVPIVTLNYWEQVKSAVDSGSELPNSEDFVPPINESFVNRGKVSLRPNVKRKTLFRNVIFVHFSARQYKMYGRMINMAGGKSLLYSKKPLSNKELCASNVIVLQYSESDTTQSTQHVVSEYDSIYNTLQANNRKMISESEIPLALLHCSMDKYCNPKFSFKEFLKRSQLKSDSSEVLALDTQDVGGDVRVLPKVISNVPVKSSLNVKNSKQVQIIPETCDINDDLLSDNNHLKFERRLRSSTPICSPEKNNIFNRNVPDTDETVQDTVEIRSKKTTKYIPETNDSSISDDTEKVTQCCTQKTLSLRKQNTNTQDNELIKESMIANKGTPFNEVIELSDDEDIELAGTQSNRRKYNKRPLQILSQQKLNELVDIYTVRERSPETNLPGNRNILSPRNSHKNLNHESQTMEENHERSKKRNKNSDDIEIEKEFVQSTNKKMCSKISSREDTIDRSRTESNYSNLSRYSSSFLRLNPNYKKFKKVYNRIPKQRITLSDMYVWEGARTF